MVIKYVIRGEKVTESDGKKTVVAHLPDVSLGLHLDSVQSSGSRENNLSRAWSSCENSSYERSHLSIQALSSWAVEGDQGQIAVTSGKTTLCQLSHFPVEMVKSMIF